MTHPLTRVAADLVPAEEYPPVTRGTVVLWGLLASYPFGGMTWQVLHHLVGLRRLGFDVWYVEDSDEPVYDCTTFWQTFEVPQHNLSYLADAMQAVGLGNRWLFRHPESERVNGCGDRAVLQDVYRQSRAVFNLCGAHVVLSHHDDIGCLVYLETDPVWSQVSLAKGDGKLAAVVDRHDHLFTYGANLMRSWCPVPTAGRTWHPTRPPVVTQWWPRRPAGHGVEAMTTIANWRHGGKDVEWEGELYQWRKDVAFAPYLDLPSRSPLPLELALGAISGQECDALRARGWRVIESAGLGDPGVYRDYVAGSIGELTAAKDQYVRTRSGWFSDRSVCYLAAGLPVVTEDTGAGEWIATGEGLLVFSTPDQALAALEAVASDLARHGKAARDLAHEVFAAERVLAEVCATAGLL